MTRHAEKTIDDLIRGCRKWERDHPYGQEASHWHVALWERQAVRNAILDLAAEMDERGEVVVPEKPTEAMCVAGCEADDPLGGLVDWRGSNCTTRDAVARVWAAMATTSTEAAPEPPQVEIGARCSIGAGSAGCNRRQKGGDILIPSALSGHGSFVRL